MVSYASGTHLGPSCTCLSRGAGGGFARGSWLDVVAVSMELPSRERAALGLINTSGTPLNCGGRESGGAVGLLDQTGETFRTLPRRSNFQERRDDIPGRAGGNIQRRPHVGLSLRSVDGYGEQKRVVLDMPPPPMC
ncbi:unnamed protein product [Gadus morhua 'NCC']